MKILFFTAGTQILASSRTRVYQYLPFLEKNGIGFKVINFASERECRANIRLEKRTFYNLVLYKFYGSLKICVLLFYAFFYDIILIQKVLLPHTLQAILRVFNKNIIFDFDDAIFSESIYKDGDYKFIRRFISMVKYSKYVILENEFTNAFVEKYNKNILMITGPINTERYFQCNKVAKDSKVIIGWIGNPGTSKFLGFLYGVFRSLSQKYNNLTIELIGVPKLDMPGVNIIKKDWNLETEVSNLHDFDIGIMPLFDDDWSKGKGGYKLLQYMAIGIPCVASPVGINKKIIREGINGYLVNTPEEWEVKLTELIEDQNLRLRMGKNGRDIAVKEYSFESNIEKFISALKEVRT